MTTQIAERTDFSAEAPLSGYLYQCNYALLDAVKRLRKDVEYSVSIETLDDIVFETSRDEYELLQTKHHVSHSANLTDASPDLWKTLRIWIEQYNSGILPTRATLYLITTSLAPDRSAANCLKAGQGRDIQGALTRLNSTASSSTSIENKKAYEVYRSLNEEDKNSLFNSVVVIDASPSLIQLDGALRDELFHAVETKYLDSFITRLMGWWYRRIFPHLSNKNIKPILGLEILDEIGNLREQFKEENLPIDDDIMHVVVDETVYQSYVFVQQLRLIEISSRRIFFAIRDYYRAYTHRLRSIREDLVLLGDLDRYEQRLIEEWEIHFERMRDELGDETTEEEKKKAAHELYRWIEEGDLTKIRTMVDEPCISRGSYHMLADDLKVGWHLEFADRLRELLGV